MIKKLLATYSNRFLSRWVVLTFDIIVVMFAFIIANILRYNFEYSQINPYELQLQTLIVAFIYLSSFVITRSYTGIVRHTSINDAYRLLQASFLSLVILLLNSTIQVVAGIDGFFNIARSILIIHFLITLFALVGSRFVVKTVYQTAVKNQSKGRQRIIIFGAGASGLITKNTLLQEKNRFYEVICFVDENPSKIGKSLEGTLVCSIDKALSKEYIEKYKINELIISVQRISTAKRKFLIERALELDLKVKTVPPIEKWINGELSTRQIRNVKIEELLERDSITLDSMNINRELRNQTILVTGAAGSIGSEIARQIFHYNPKQVILLDQAESALYDLQSEMLNGPLKAYFNKAHFIICNIKDYLRVERVFDTYKPDIVFHAAAYKHVPLMENNPYEAVLINIFGSKILADLAIEYKVKKFVMVSTDKAVNPTNVMGATKRTAEMYMQYLNGQQDYTHFITTRFGNVLGSNGSVIPLFRRQIEKGGPITITHKEITRYFMTIPEACNLVLEAGAMGNGGEIFVFDMGESVRIQDLAEKMIKLSGLEVGKDIEITYSGLRPGEKLYEELLSDNENTIKTHHPKISISKVAGFNFETMPSHLDELSELIVNTDDFGIVRKLKDIVPEYRSNNSIYETLDKTKK
ncbi:MAG: polysaccharide biosynthesis protein [Schleiferiaceae bacterium]|nr:polysaccharide biosynthesis protein [Schleiferiaceae bacterium]